MGAWAGKRERPRANMDNARSLDQSCIDHEFINGKLVEPETLGCFLPFLPRPGPGGQREPCGIEGTVTIKVKDLSPKPLLALASTNMGPTWVR